VSGSAEGDLEVGALALVADADGELVERGVPVEGHVDAGWPPSDAPADLSGFLADLNVFLMVLL